MSQSAATKPKRQQPRGGSRKGCPNKITRTIKEEVLASFEIVGARQYLVQQARENPPAYLNLLGKVIPQQVQGALEGLTIVVQQIAVDAKPVPGVLNSPIAAHVWPAIANRAEVIDAQPIEELQ